MPRLNAYQYFGTIDTLQGKASATISIDEDSPTELMVHWYGPGVTAGGVLAAATSDNEGWELVPRVLYRVGEHGNLIPPPELTAEEQTWMRGTKARLRATATGLEGEWSGPDDTKGKLQFTKPAAPESTLKATQCESWGQFKAWAEDLRSAHNARWFRGHGSNAYSLRTTLHRAGRNRLERYITQELVQFKMYAEAVFSKRFDFDDGRDYSTVVALAQHHGLPTPMLDWTESAYIAAFFAFSDAVATVRSRSAPSHVRIYAVSEEFIKVTSPSMVYLTAPQPFVATLAVDPIHNPRLSAQQGRFMVTNVANVEDFIRGVETKIGRQDLFAADVPFASAAEALQDLAFMGLTGATMFPGGLDGISLMIRHEMYYKTPRT